MADKRDILIRLLGEETVSRMADRAGDGLDRFGHKLDATEHDAKNLDRQIGETEHNLKALAVAFARTNDAADRVDLTKAMRRQQTELRRLTKAKDLLPDLSGAGTSAAVQFAKNFLPALRGALMGGPGAVIAATVAVPLVATIGAAVGGAVVGGIGVGGVVGGIALAAKDSRVRDAGKHLGDAVMGDLEDSATRFVSPTIRGIQIIEGAWHDVSDTVDDVFASTSRYVEPLARGVAGAVREIAPGLREAAAAAGPIIDVLGQELPELGAALSDMFSDFADHADEGASALRFLFMLMESGVDATSAVVSVLSDVYRVLIDVNDGAATVAETMFGWLPGVGDYIKANAAKAHELKAGLDKTGQAGGEAGAKIEGGLRKVETAAGAAGGKVRSLQDIMDEFAGKTLDSRDASRQFEEAVDAASESVKKNGHALSDGTAKGRANQAALDAIAKATYRKRDAVLAETNSQEKANAVTAAGRAAFLKAADAMHMEAGKAKALADKLFGIPNVNRTVTVNNKQALAAISRVQSGIDGLHGKDLHVGVYFTKHGDLKLPGGTSLKGAAYGGPITGPGPKGVDSVPMVLAPGEHVLTSDEVDAAGGHAAVERLRAMLRSGRGHGAAVASAAGNWAPRTGSTVNHYSINVQVPATANMAEVGRVTVRAIQEYERGSGKGWRT